MLVSRPFEGPIGGTVMTLASARRKYRSGCLYGPGPKFAIVGTNRTGWIQGTRGADRILGLGGNDRIAGQGGNDCFDAGAGNDRVFGGNGNDRISVGTGRDHIFGGPGNVRLFGRGLVVYVARGGGRGTVYVNAFGMRYARAHGCATVRKIRTHVL